MHIVRSAALLLACFSAFAAGTDTAYTPLWQYQGTWQVVRAGSAPNAPKEELTNQCSLIGKFFACEQKVNGKTGGLLVIVPSDQPGHYSTQTILPEGRATGRDDLSIEGNRWTYESRRQVGSKVTLYRTVNTFVTKDRIHFEQAESTEKNVWVVKGSGDERRISGGTHSSTK